MWWPPRSTDETLWPFKLPIPALWYERLSGVACKPNYIQHKMTIYLLKTMYLLPCLQPTTIQWLRRAIIEGLHGQAGVTGCISIVKQRLKGVPLHLCELSTAVYNYIFAELFICSLHALLSQQAIHKHCNGDLKTRLNLNTIQWKPNKNRITTTTIL